MGNFHKTKENDFARKRYVILELIAVKEENEHHKMHVMLNGFFELNPVFQNT